MKTIGLLFAILLVFNTASAAQTCSEIFVKVKAPKSTETFSQAIRSNPQAFFTFLNNFAAVHPELLPYLKHEGWISGDSHPGQWSFVPNNGKYIYTLVDFDMAGRGPLLLDFMQYVLNIKGIISQSPASKNNIRVTEMLEAYMKGLTGEKMRAPKWAKEVLERDGKDFLKEEQKYYHKKVEKNGKALKMELGFAPITSKDLRNKIVKSLKETEFFSDYHIQDVIQKEIDRGGSAGQQRYWVLAREKRDKDIVRIFELKEKQAGILPDANKSTEAMYDLFWSGEYRPAYFDVKIGHDSFEVRPKKVALDESDIAYNLNKNKEWQYLAEKAYYDLYLMGQAQSSQQQTASLVHLMSENPKTIIRLTKEFSEIYIKEHDKE